MSTTGTSPAERAATIERILRPILPVLADPGSPPETVAYARDVLRKVTALIDGLHGISQSAPSGPSEQAQAHDARARARESGPAEIARLERAAEREAAGLRRLRKGRHQCEATARGGGRCQAPAIPGGSVCRRHGGAASQVRLQAAMTALYEARSQAGEAWEAARGTPGEFDAMCAWSRADNAVKRAEEKMDRIRELQAELHERKTGRNPE